MKIYRIICTDDSGILVTIVLTLLVSVIGFYEYLFQGQLFFVSAGDALTQMFPQIVEMHYQLYDNKSLMWSFYQGLGAPIFAGNPNHHGDIFAWILAALPIDCMPTGIIYIHILKLVCAASLFYLFLSQFKSLSIVTKIIGSMCYAFSGVMLCRGPWWHYATEVVMIVPVLIGLEKWYRNNNSFFIVVAFALLLISRYATYAYVDSIYVYGYIILRSVYDGNISFLNLLKRLVCFSSRYFMGIGLAAIFLVPGLINFFESARTIGDIWINIIHAFSLENSKTIMSNILKLYQPNITGQYGTGIGNVLEDMCGYSGVLFLLLCASACVNKVTSVKKEFLIFFLVTLYIFSVFPRSLLNAFAYNSAKTSSIWINIALITLGVHILERIDPRKILIACIGLLFLLGITFMKYRFTGMPIVLEEVYCAVVLLIAYTVILLLYNYRKIDKCKYTILLLCVVIIECCISCSFSVIQVKNNMKMLSQKNIWENLYYIHEDLGNLYDNNDFFRIAILHKNAVLESDASINRYYGFDRYNSINNKAIVDFTDLFYNNMGAAKSHYMHGLNDYEGIRNMFSGKYICDDTTGEVVVNQDCMPLGYLYDYYANVNDVDKYPSNIRDDIISKAAIVSDSVSDIKNYFDSFDVVKTSNYSLKKLYTNDLQEVNAVSNGRYNITGDDPFIVYEIPEVVNINNNDILSMDVDVHVRRSDRDLSDISNMNYQVYFSADSNGFCEDGSFFTSIRNGKSSPYLPEYIDGSKFFRLDIGRKGQILELSNVNLSTWDIKPRNGDENYKPYVPLDKNSVCEMKSFSTTEIHLKANNDDPRILFLSIPYDSGWSIYDNGKQVEVMHVNIGFIGTYLEPGEHNLIVKYRTPGLYEGAVVSGVTAIGLLYMWIRRRKNREVENAI